jgi:titin
LPAQTTGLAATAISASEVDLAWSQAAGAATYIAQRAPSGTSNWTTLAAGLTATAFADTTVAPGTSYDYRVTAVDAAGNGQASATATALTGPGAPALTASTPSTSEIDLSWTAGSGATSYDVQRGVVGSGTFGTDLGSTSTTTFADQGLDPGSSYDYRVVPSGAAGQGVPSNVVTGTTLPAQVTGLSATAVSPTEVDLSWPSAAGAVTYLVQRAPTGTTAWTVVSAGASNLTLADTGLAPNTGYDYEVAGVDAGGTGAFSTIQTATTPAAPPAQVTGLTATAVSTTEIDLGWTPTPGATSYEVDRSTSPTDGFSPIATGLASPSFADTTPAPQTTYWYQVIAGNPTGTGPASTAASTATLPDQVTGLGATAISASEIDLAWNPAGGAITYVVQRAPSGSGNWTTLSAGASSTALADTAVSAGTSYDYRVAATGVGGTGAFSTTQSATTPQQIPQQVTGLTATSASAAEIDLTWTPAAGATGYEVDRSTSPTTGFTSVATGLSTTSFADTTASSNTTYWYQVIAGNSAGPAPASDPTSATTRPDQVSGLSATAVSPAEVDLSWNPVGGATGYLVRRAPAGTGNWTTIAPNVSVTSFADQTVAPTTGYDYQVAAIGVGGTGAFSAIQSATTPLAPPAQVTGLTATAVSGSEIDLSWATTQGATGYEVDRSATSATGGYAPLTTGLTSTSFADKSVSAGTTYWYEVKASNQAGPGPASTAASATTPSSTPALLSNGFEGGSSGSAITAANSGGASGNAFNAVSCTGGAATFTTAAAHGSRAAAFSPTTSACFVQWGTNSIPVPSTTSYGRMYVNLTSATGPTMLLAKLANSAVARDAQIDVSSTGRLALYDANGTVRLTFGTTVPSGWVRIEWKLVNSTTNGSLTVSMYAADSLTPLETHTVTGINTGASFGALQVGSVVATSPAPAPFRIDDVAYGVVGPLGPAH